MKTEKLYCDMCKKEINPCFDKLKELEIPIYSTKYIEQNWHPKYEKRNICRECANKIAEKIFTIEIEKHIKEEVKE